MKFTINNPVPVAGAVTPQNVAAGSSASILNVAGSGFTHGSVVLVNGGSRATSYLNPTLLQATLAPSDLAQSGTLDIAVINAPPGGGTAAATGVTVAGYSLTPPVSQSQISAGQTAQFDVLTISPLEWPVFKCSDSQRIRTAAGCDRFVCPIDHLYSRRWTSSCDAFDCYCGAYKWASV